MITRRHFVAGAAATAFAAPALLRAQSVFRTYPFSLGIASGDPAPDGFVIWTRLAPDPLEQHGGMAMAPMPVEWEVASDQAFTKIVARGQDLARPELAHSVHVEVAGLQPDRPYWYRFTAGGERSFNGRARTLPLALSSPEALRFGVCGCQAWDDGYYTAYRAMAKEDLAFVFHYGDYIYDFKGGATRTSRGGGLSVAVRQSVGQELYELADYRRRYAQYKTDPDLQRAHAAHSFFMTFDDHEITDNWVGDVDSDETPPELFRTRRAAALQAWYEHMPVRRALMPRFGQVALHRSARYGNLVEMDFLDTRQFRSDQPCGDGFKPACPQVQASDAAVLGAEQEAWLLRNMTRKDARWNCLAQQIMMMSLDRRTENEPAKILNLDSWAAYEVPRRRLLSRMRGLDNVIVLTGDEHQNFAGLLQDGETPVAVEFVGTSISSGGDGSDQRRGSDKILGENPQLKFVNDQRGYLTCDVAPGEWRTNFMVVDQISTPAGKVSKRATAVVERGRPDIHMA
jgi:alkaline phosphatase D